MRKLTLVQIEALKGSPDYRLEVQIDRPTPGVAIVTECAIGVEGDRQELAYVRVEGPLASATDAELEAWWDDQRATLAGWPPRG